MPIESDKNKPTKAENDAELIIRIMCGQLALSVGHLVFNIGQAAGKW